MTNVISLADMAEECQITIDAKIEKVMHAHMKDKAIRFRKMRNI